MLKKLTFLILLGLIGLQLNVSAQAPILQKNDFFSNSKLRTWYGFNTSHSTKVLDVERVISENEFKELKTLRPFFRDTFNFQVLITDTDGIQKIVNVSLVLASEFMCAVETWNTACGFPNGRVIVYIEGGVTDYHVSIWRNSDGVKVFQADNSNTRFEKKDLKADGYKVIVDDSNTPVQNNYTLFNAEVKTSSSPVISIDAKYNENCGGKDGWIQAKAVSGVGPYKFKLLKTGEENFTGKFINLSFGTYEIEVSDANFCKDITSATIFNIGTPVYSKPIERKLCSFIKSLDTLKSGFTKSGCDTFTVFKNLLAKTSFDTLKFSTCDTTKVGVFLDTAFKHTGLSCDSLRKYKEYVLTKALFGHKDSLICDSLMFNQVRSLASGVGVNGCDSFTIVTYKSGFDTVLLTHYTCHLRPDSIKVVPRAFNCDSIRIIHYALLVARDTFYNQKSCLARTDTIIQRFNSEGCVVLNEHVKFVKSGKDTTKITKDTCYAGSSNFYYTVFPGQNGECDSVVSVTLNVLKTEIRRDSAYFCGLKKTSTRRDTLFHNLGCPSIITIFDSLAPPAVIRSTVFRYSCDPDSVKQGTYYDTTRFDYGCIKSIVTLRLRDAKTTNNLADTVLINQNIDTIIFVSKTFVNQYNCDSIVNRKWIYDKAEVYWVPDDSTNCGFKPSETILVQKLKTYYGSDSLVKRKLITFESPKGKIDNFSHVPAPGQKGFIETSATGGKLPYTWEWNTGENTDDIYNLSGGTYVLTITTADGCKDTLERGIAYFRAWSDARGILTVGCGLADQSHFVDYGSQFGHLVVYEAGTGKILHQIQRVDMSVENIFTIPISAKGKIIVMMYFDSDATPLKDSSVSF